MHCPLNAGTRMYNPVLFSLFRMSINCSSLLGVPLSVPQCHSPFLSDLCFSYFPFPLLCFFSFIHSFFFFFFFFFLGLSAGLKGSKFPDQRSNLCLLQWKYGVLTSGPPGNSSYFFISDYFYLLKHLNPE